MLATFGTLEAHIVKKHCDSAVYYECEEKTCGGILYSYGTFLRHCVNEHGKLEENRTLKLKIYNSVKDSIEKLIFEQSNAYTNPGKDETATNRNHFKVAETKRKRSHSPDFFEQNEHMRSVLRRLSDVLSNNDSGNAETFENDFSFMTNTRASISAQNVLRKISDVLNSDDLNCPDINSVTELNHEKGDTVSGITYVDQTIAKPLDLNSNDLYPETAYPVTYICQNINSTTELYNEQNGTFNTTADFDQTLEESIDVISLSPCKNSDTKMQSRNNTYYTSNRAPDAYYIVVDSGFVPDFNKESVASRNTPTFQTLDDPNEETGINQDTENLQCKHCQMKFSYQKDMKRHISTVHMNRKLYKCNLCSFSTIYDHSFKAHMNNHNGVKPFKCNMCDYASVESIGLKRHMSVHGETPYKCNKCFYASSRNDRLKSICFATVLINVSNETNALTLLKAAAHSEDTFVFITTID